MLTGHWRRAAAVYLALFFCAVAAAPHHHVNGLEDLLFDQPSDSGLIVQPTAQPADDRPAVTSVHYIQDFPCLACFMRDSVASPAVVIAFAATLTPLILRPTPVPVSRLEPVFAERSSRAPPGIS